MVTTRTRTDYEFNAAVNQKLANRKLTRSPVLQAIAFCVVTINNEYTKPGSKRKLRGLI